MNKDSGDGLVPWVYKDVDTNGHDDNNKEKHSADQSEAEVRIQ
jgi:hypothetical protein